MKKIILFSIALSVFGSANAMFRRAFKVVTQRALSTASTKLPDDVGDEITLLTRKIRNLPRVHDGSNPQFAQFFEDLQLGDDFFRAKTPEELNTHVQTIVAEILTGKLGLYGNKAIQAAMHPSTLTEEVKVRMTHARLCTDSPTLKSRYLELDHSHEEEILKQAASELLINAIIYKISAAQSWEASAAPIDPQAIKALRKALFKQWLHKSTAKLSLLSCVIAVLALYEYAEYTQSRKFRSRIVD